MKTTFIYALCEPGTRTVRYIGKADDPKKRLRRHLKVNSIRAKSHIGCWIRSLVSTGAAPELVILSEVPRDAWQAEEIRYIHAARVLGFNLTNGTEGGDGGLNPSSETLSRMRRSHLGLVHTPEHNKKISASMMGKQNSLGHKQTETTRAKISAATSGKNNPRFGLPSANRGVPWTPERRAAQNKKGASV